MRAKSFSMKTRFPVHPAAMVPIFLAGTLLLFSCGGGAMLQPPPPASYKLAWSDELSGPDGASPDSSKWTYDVGGNGWGNNELEYYTNRTKNAQIQGGNLMITAQKETYAGSDGVTRNYTSARLKTQGLFSQAYGRFEARIKIPAGQGMWPAFWMLGNDITYNGWPKCGEIDIMENIGKEPGTVHGSLHGPSTVGQRATPPRPSACPPARISPMTFISTRSNGSPAQSASTSTPLFTLHSSRHSGPPAVPGFSITPSSSSSTSPWGAIGPARPTAPPFSPSKCSSITSASTPSNSPVTRLLGDEDLPFVFFLRTVRLCI